ISLYSENHKQTLVTFFGKIRELLGDEMMENVCVELKNIKHAYLDRTILNINRLAVHQFDRIGLVGRNGSGKSTLLKLIASEITPNHGKVNRLIDFAYFDQFELTDKNDANYDLISKLSIPDTSI